MEVKELEEFAEWENKRVEKASGKSNEELIDSQALKIAEEYGEFVNEFLKLRAWQRKDKIKDIEKTKEEMKEELADLILVTFLVGKRLNINIEEEIKKKIKKVKERVY